VVDRRKVATLNRAGMGTTGPGTRSTGFRNASPSTSICAAESVCGSWSRVRCRSSESGRSDC